MLKLYVFLKKQNVRFILKRNEVESLSRVQNKSVKPTKDYLFHCLSIRLRWA